MVLSAGVAVYALAGFLIAPRAIKLWIESPNVSGPVCRLRVQQVYVNPFTMFLSFGNATLFDAKYKLLVSATSVETAVWTLAMFRDGRPGRDVALRNLVVARPNSDETILSVPRVFARSVTLGIGRGPIDAAYVRLERPDAAITRDAAGIRQSPASLSENDRAAACLSLESLRAVGGRLRLRDNAVTPAVQLELHDVAAGARREPGEGAAITSINVDARVGAAGTINLKVRRLGLDGHHPDSFSMTARNIELRPLSPYFRHIFGRDIVAGSVDAGLHHERAGATLRIDNDLILAGLRLGDPDVGTADDTLPLELALALATDLADRSRFAIRSSVSDLQARSVTDVFVDSLAAHVDELAARPFGELARLVGDANAVLDEVIFMPGSADMAPAATGNLALLALALELRPRLGVRVQPAYDAAVDRDAIAARQVRLHIALATSKGVRERGDTGDPDFDDPRVRDILDEFAGTRLSEAQRRAITGDVGDQITRYRGIYRALVANEPVSETVLRRLARFRARSIIDALAREGTDRIRLRIDDALETVATGSEMVALQVEAEARPAPEHGEAQETDIQPLRSDDLAP